jgi:arsenite methyltransferase
MAQISFDESMVGRLEELYRKRDLLRRRQLVHEALGAQPGEHVLDAGCGPGFYVSELLEVVGPQGSVTGVDISADMLAVAAKRCEGYPGARFAEGEVTSLPVGDGEFDRALSVQVLEYVPDVDRALHELRRALRPGGRLVVWDVDWSTLSWHSSRSDLTERVVRAWDDHLTHPALPRTLAAQMRAAGFAEVEAVGHAFVAVDFSDETYAVATMGVIEQYVAGHPDVGAEAAAEWVAEQKALGERGELFAACIQFCFTGVRA